MTIYNRRRTLSETGFVGRNITDTLEDLYLESGKDMKIAEEYTKINLLVPINESKLYTLSKK